MVRGNFDGVVAQCVFRYDIDLDGIVVDYAPMLEDEQGFGYNVIRKEFAKRMIFEGLDIIKEMGVIDSEEFRNIENIIDECTGGRYFDEV